MAEYSFNVASKVFRQAVRAELDGHGFVLQDKRYVRTRGPVVQDILVERPYVDEWVLELTWSISLAGVREASGLSVPVVPASALMTGTLSDVSRRHAHQYRLVRDRPGWGRLLPGGRGLTPDVAVTRARTDLATILLPYLDERLTVEAVTDTVSRRVVRTRSAKTSRFVADIQLEGWYEYCWLLALHFPGAEAQAEFAQFQAAVGDNLPENIDSGHLRRLTEAIGR